MFRQGMTPISGYKFIAGIAYIALPTDLDRDVYINDCYRNNHVSIIHEDGGFSNRTPISPDVLNQVDFPLSPDKFGSPIVYVTEPIRNQHIIVCRLNKSQDIGDLKEGQFKIRRKFGDAYVEIAGSSQDKSLSLTVDGADDAGQIDISIFNKNNNGALNISVAGKTNITTTEDLVLRQFNSASILVLDEDADIETNFIVTKQGITSKAAKLKINEGNEPFTLGNKMKAFLDDLLDEIGKSTVTTALGQMPLLNATQIIAFKGRTDEFLSTVMFIDK